MDNYNHHILDKRTDKGISTLTQPIKSGGSDSILANLFRKILKENGITGERFEQLMEIWLRDRRNAIPQNVKDRASARGNFKKELFKPSMSWKVLCKGLRFINAERIDLMAKITYLDGTTSEHVTSANLGRPIIDTSFDEGDKIITEAKESLDNKINLILSLNTGKPTQYTAAVEVDGDMIVHSELTDEDMEFFYKKLDLKK